MACKHDSFYLGIEFGSTRIKAVAIDEKHNPVSSGDYTWKSTYENGVWTYDLSEVWAGLKAALAGVENRENIAAMGISGMTATNAVAPRTGNVSAGTSIFSMVVLEELAFMAFHTEIMNPGIGPMQRELLDKHYLRKHGKNAYYGQN